jgi:proline iminopeptidase
MKTLYSELRVDLTGELAVDAIHSIYWEVSGNPDGVPVLFIHGGPGAGSSHNDRRFFDPARYRIVLFDQRGSGRSTPHAELQNNTTADLISDIEALREHLNIDRWVLFGGSWGSTLGLLYAQAFPERVMAMILRGIFLCRAVDLHWFYQSGADRIFPDYWEDFIAHIPESERDNLMRAYYERLTGANELAKMSCAKAWSTWEGRCATLRPNPEIVHFFAEPHRALSLARIEAHYFVNDAFIAPNQIIDNAHKLKNIRGIIVHGRYDVVCPLDNAFALHQAWPGSELQIIRDAGHSSMEPSIVDALVRATDQIADELYPDS